MPFEVNSEVLDRFDWYSQRALASSRTNAQQVQVFNRAARVLEPIAQMPR